MTKKESFSSLMISYRIVTVLIFASHLLLYDEEGNRASFTTEEGKSQCIYIHLDQITPRLLVNVLLIQYHYLLDRNNTLSGYELEPF